MLVEPPAPTDDLESFLLLARTGQVTTALRLLEALPERPDEPLRTARTLATLLECRLARGDFSRAGRSAERLAPYAGHEGLTGAVARHALAELATAQGDHESAARRYAEAGSLLDDATDDPDLVPWRSGSALALTRLSRHREARALAASHLELARRVGSPYAVAQALRTLAATNTDGSRIALLREARAALDGVRAERLTSQIDTDLAGLLALLGGPVSLHEAIRLLRGAEAYAGREDLVPLQTRVRGLLERLGEQPRRIRSESLASLTTSEEKAARLAADGLTNREIAARMRLTVKAVEWHLSHVYRKLGIAGRTGLPESLGIAV